jgi:hypothetical protein
MNPGRHAFTERRREGKAKIARAGSTPADPRRDGWSQPPGPLFESGSSPGSGRWSMMLSITRGSGMIS